MTPDLCSLEQVATFNLYTPLAPVGLQGTVGVLYDAGAKIPFSFA